MKVHSCARDMNLNGKCVKKKYVEIQNFVFKENKTVIFFLIQMFYSYLGYLAGIMVLMSRQYFYSVSNYLNHLIRVTLKGKSLLSREQNL